MSPFLASKSHSKICGKLTPEERNLVERVTHQTCCDTHRLTKELESKRSYLVEQQEIVDLGDDDNDNDDSNNDDNGDNDNDDGDHGNRLH